MTEPSHTIDVQRILEERARALATPPQAATARDTVDVLVINIAAERYAIRIEQVREVRPVEALTPVPDLPAMWGGLVNLRGVLCPVLDTARYLGLDAADDGERHIVLVASSGLVVGLLADEVVGLRRLSPGEIRPPLEADSDGVHRVVDGVTPDLLLVIDAEALLNDPRLVVEEEAF